MNEDTVKQIEALEERLDIELTGLRVLAQTTENLLKQVLEIEQAVKEMNK